MALLTSFWVYDVLLLLASIVAAIYLSFKYRYQHWRRRGISCPSEPSFPSGNFPGVIRTNPIYITLSEIYKNNPNERMVGCYFLNKPIILLRDLELIKNILIRDFDSFHDRGIAVNTDRDPLFANLVMMNGKEWRNLRTKLTPTFTTGKMKMMFPTMLDVGKQLVKTFQNESLAEETEMKGILSRYTSDVISSVAFGIDTNSLNNPQGDVFIKMATGLTKPTIKQIAINFIIFLVPKLSKYLPLRMIPKDTSDFFLNVVRETIDFRLKNNFRRNDFMQLLLELKTLGYVKDADNSEQEILDQQKFTVEQAAAQAFLFFVAGFDPSSATMQYSLYEMALNPELQKLAQQEIDRIIAKHNGEFTYEGLAEMSLIDRIVAETLRKYPATPALMRECTKEYSVPDSELKILPRDTIWISIYGIHHDPQYYPDPEEFDPDRFLPEVKETRPSICYLPFGDGPRSCIGNRFGLMQAKTGLAIILSQFSIAPSKRTPIPIVFDPQVGVTTPKEDIYLKISKREIKPEVENLKHKNNFVPSFSVCPGQKEFFI